MLLKDQITQEERLLWRMRADVAKQEAKVKFLKTCRLDCAHKFDTPLTGYEHEGGHCIYCGINELAAIPSR